MQIMRVESPILFEFWVLNFEFWIIAFGDFEFWILNCDLIIQNSKLKNSKSALPIIQNSKLKIQNSKSALPIIQNSKFKTQNSKLLHLQLCTPSVASSAVSTLTINWSTVFRVSFFLVSLMIVTVFLRVIHTCLFVLSFRFLPSAQLLEVIVFFLRQSSLKS